MMFFSVVKDEANLIHERGVNGAVRQVEEGEYLCMFLQTYVVCKCLRSRSELRGVCAQYLLTGCVACYGF